MNAPRDPDVILAAWLDDGPADLPSSTRRAISTAVRTTPQSRAGLGLPAWRPTMSKFLVLAGAAAVVAVAVGAFAILTPRPTGNLGPGAVAPAPTPTSTPSATAAPTATPAPSEVAPGITGWTPFTSEVYGVTFSLPDGWRQVDAATRRWRASDQGKETDEQIYDVLLNPSDRDGEDIAMLAYQRLAGSGADITSREGLAAWVEANLCGEYDPGQDPAQACYVVEPMCVGKTACRPAILVSDPGSVLGIIPDAETGLVTIVQLGRGPDFPATARYGGGVQLVKSILTTMDVWTPEPGQLPSGG